MSPPSLAIPPTPPPHPCGNYLHVLHASDHTPGLEHGHADERVQSGAQSGARPLPLPTVQVTAAEEIQSLAKKRYGIAKKLALKVINKKLVLRFLARRLRWGVRVDLAASATAYVPARGDRSNIFSSMRCDRALHRCAARMQVLRCPRDPRSIAVPVYGLYSGSKLLRNDIRRSIREADDGLPEVCAVQCSPARHSLSIRPAPFALRHATLTDLCKHIALRSVSPGVPCLRGMRLPRPHRRVMPDRRVIVPHGQPVWVSTEPATSTSPAP